MSTSESAPKQPATPHQVVEPLRNYLINQRAHLPTDAALRRDARALLRNAVNKQAAAYYYCYRFMPDVFDLEADVRLLFSAFQNEEREAEYPLGMRLADLKLLRRVMFRRAAFGLASTISAELAKKENRDRKESWLWLNKDFVLPRIPLSLVVGFAAALSGDLVKFFYAARGNGWYVVFHLAGSALLAWFLVYNNLRDRIGRGPKTNKRTWWVFGIALGWTALYWFAGWLFALGFKLDFDVPTSVMIAANALLIAILTQFFFAKDGSISDPL